MPLIRIRVAEATERYSLPGSGRAERLHGAKAATCAGLRRSGETAATGRGERRQHRGARPHIQHEKATTPVAQEEEKGDVRMALSVAIALSNACKELSSKMGISEKRDTFRKRSESVSCGCDTAGENNKSLPRGECGRRLRQQRSARSHASTHLSPRIVRGRTGHLFFPMGRKAVAEASTGLLPRPLRMNV